MSRLNPHQKFLEEIEKRNSIDLPNPISAILDYCQYKIRIDFNQKQKKKYLTKNRKSELCKQFTQSFATLTWQEKIQYFITVVGFLANFANNNFEPPEVKFSGSIHTIGYSRSFNVKRWKEKKLRLDLDKQLMFAERQQKIKSYDFRNYILRRSKNKDYHSFVLEAINNVPPQKSMTVHIGFIQQKTLNQWLKAIKYSVERRQWQYYLQLYKAGGGFSKATSMRQFASSDQLSKSIVIADSRKNTSEVNQARLENSEILSQSMVIESKNAISEPQQYVQFKKQNKIPIVILNDEAKRELKISNTTNEKQVQITKINSQNIQEKLKLEQEIKQYQALKQVGKTIVDQLIEGDVFEEPDVFEQKIEEENEESKQIKKHLDLFHKLYPQYQLEELEIYSNFQQVHDSEKIKIYQHSILQRRLKLVISFNKQTANREKILSIVSKPQTAQIFNDNIQSVQLKTYIPSENSALIYQVNKPYNRLYRARDFVFIRHVFSQSNKLYMIDKSIQNTNYPPFMTIVRGSLCVVYGIFERNTTIQLIADFQVQNQGLLNPVQETNLTLKYLKGFNKLLDAQIPTEPYKFFQLDWDISKNQANKIQNEIRFRRKTINQIDKKFEIQQKLEQKPAQQIKFTKKQPRNDRVQVVNVVNSTVSPAKQNQVQSPSHSHKPPEPYQQKSVSPINKTAISPQNINHQSPPAIKKVQIKRFDQKTMQQVGEINVQESKNKPIYYDNVKRNLDANGMVIIDNSFKKTKYRLQPQQSTLVKFMEPENGHPIWKGQWIHDDKQGSMIFIHKKKIQDQKGVLKFVLSKIAKNLLSGQSITQISLPVDIFGPESNLQRFLFSMLYAPLVLQRLQKENNLQRLIKSTIFGLSNSILYLSMQKPFNPILGQTFQCWINGCPAYAEQISHHPPIGALMFKGRGYDITAQLESKVSLGLNSGTGTNDGIYRIKFKDGVEICFITPGGEVSGLTAGDRKFNIVGKSYYWITDTNIMLEIVFDPAKKGFFSVGKQAKPLDYFQGTIWEVKPQFMTKFLSGKRREPEEKQRLKDYGKISGIWNKYISYNGNQIWNFDKQFPVKLEYQANPLPSDSNWREDIEYRRKNEVTRAQMEKERLQVLQRKDRKLREKYQKKK